MPLKSLHIWSVHAADLDDESDSIVPLLLARLLKGIWKYGHDNIVWVANQNILYFLLESKEPKGSSWAGPWSLKLGLASCHWGFARTWKSQAINAVVEWEDIILIKRDLVDQYQALPSVSVVKDSQISPFFSGGSFFQMTPGRCLVLLLLLLLLFRNCSVSN